MINFHTKVANFIPYTPCELIQNSMNPGFLAPLAVRTLECTHCVPA